MSLIWCTEKEPTYILPHCYSSFLSDKRYYVNILAMENFMSYDYLSNCSHLLFFFRKITCSQLTLMTNMKVKRFYSNYISSKVIFMPIFFVILCHEKVLSSFPAESIITVSIVELGKCIMPCLFYLKLQRFMF